MRLCITRDGGRYVVGEVDWPDSIIVTHVIAWRGYSPREIGAFLGEWERMRRRLG